MKSRTMRSLVLPRSMLFVTRRNMELPKGAICIMEIWLTLDADPAVHFMGKTIRATGTVKVVQDVPRIEIDDAEQTRVVEVKEK